MDAVLRSARRLTINKAVLLRMWSQSLQRLGSTEPTVLLRFVIVGSLTAAIYFTVLILLSWGTNLSNSLSGAIAFIFAIIPNYFLQKRATFRSSASHGSALPKYLAIVIGGLTINIAILGIGVDWLAINLFLTHAVAVASMILWNFALMRCWVFFENWDIST